MRKQQQFLRNISYALDIIITLFAYAIAKKIVLNIGYQAFNYNFLFLKLELFQI